MGCKNGEIVAIVLCFAGLAVMFHQRGDLLANSQRLKSQERVVAFLAVPSIASHLCDLTKQEINSISSSPPSSSSSSSSLPLSSSPSTPILDLVGESLSEAIPVVSQFLSEEIIAVVVTHAGFFPSNVMQTLQDLLEYDSSVMATSVSELLQNVAASYYYFGNLTDNSNYHHEGVFSEELSQIFGVVANVPQLSHNTEIPVQDSWLGNFFVSLPNITYQTTANTTSWTAGFSNAAHLFHNLGKNRWAGSYYSGNDPDNGRIDWNCGGCDDTFHDIGNQAAILAAAPYDPQDVEENVVVASR